VIAVLTVTISSPAAAQEFAPEQVRKGADIYAQNCAPCHGARMLDPDSAFDLRKFPPGEKTRFVNSVMRGKNQMPPWSDLLQPPDIEALWAYVRAGER
jgi:mono/diheme cytochrome c family protein